MELRKHVASALLWLRKKSHKQELQLMRKLNEKAVNALHAKENFSGQLSDPRVLVSAAQYAKLRNLRSESENARFEAEAYRESLRSRPKIGRRLTRLLYGSRRKRQ